MRKPFRFVVLVLFVLVVVGCAGVDRGGTTDGSTGSTDGGTTTNPKTETLVGQHITYLDDVDWPTDSTYLEWCFCPRGDLFHDGINVPGETGDPIHSVADGTVVKTTTEKEGQWAGIAVLIEHQLDTPITYRGETYSKVYSVYAHLESAEVNEGDQVSKGQEIGTMDTTGAASMHEDFVHLHLGMLFDTDISSAGRKDGGYINPLVFLPYTDTNSLTAEVIDTNPVKVLVSVPRTELDFNEISISYQGKTKTINLDEGEGIDPNDISNADYDGVLWTPERDFTPQDIYELTFTFDNFEDYDSIDVTDIWGNGVRLTKEQEVS